MSRIQLTDTITDMVIKMSEGNPGAIACLAKVLHKKDWSHNRNGFLYILALDTLELYGEKLYMLWNDCCDRDLEKLELVICNWQRGKLDRGKIGMHLIGGRGNPFEDLVPLEELYK